MNTGRTNFVDQEYTKKINEFKDIKDVLVTKCETVANSTRYFLSNEQHKIVVKEPSAAVAEKQMKSVANYYNERKEQIEECFVSVEKFINDIDELEQKLEKNGYTKKINQLKEIKEDILVSYEPLKELIEELNVAKKKKLGDLKVKILKAERVRHFKNLK